MPIPKLQVKQETSLAKIGVRTCRLKATEPIAAHKCSHSDLAVSRGRAKHMVGATLAYLHCIGQ